MTCIVGIAAKGKVWMGGDSCASDGSEKVIRKDPKVFIKEDFLIGYSGSFRLGQILKYRFDPPVKRDEQEDFEYLVTDWLDALRHTCKGSGLTKIDDNEESVPGGALIGYNGRLYVLEEDFQIGEPKCNYYAIGCGSGVAFGSLYTTMLLTKRMLPRRKIQQALEAATTYAMGVEPPFTILSN